MSEIKIADHFKSGGTINAFDVSTTATLSPRRNVIDKKIAGHFKSGGTISAFDVSTAATCHRAVMLSTKKSPATLKVAEQLAV